MYDQRLMRENAIDEVMPRSGDTITPEESVNLMRLYSELADLAWEARDTIRRSVAGITLSRLRTIDDRIEKKLHGIKATVR